MRRVYMEVTPDRYELPVAVADSIYELAQLRCVGATAIKRAAYKRGAYSKKTCTGKSKYIVVTIEIDDDDESGEQ